MGILDSLPKEELKDFLPEKLIKDKRSPEKVKAPKYDIVKDSFTFDNRSPTSIEDSRYANQKKML